MRRTFRGRLLGAAVIVPVLLSAAACGGDDNKEKKADAPSSAPSAAPGTSAPTAPAAAPTPAAGKSLTKEQLKAAALTSADVPGYTVEYEDDEGGGPGTADKAACQPLLDLFGLRYGTAKPTAFVEGSAEAEAGPTRAETTEIGIGAYAAGDAEKLYKAGTAAIDGCASFNATDDGSVVPYAVSKVAQPTLGDAAVALKVKAKAEEFNLEMNIVIVRSGDVISEYITTGLDTATAAVPEEALVKKQVEKLKAAAKG